MSALPDVVSSSGVSIKSEPTEESPVIRTRVSSTHHQEDDPIIRTIDVYISPELSSTLHLLQFPIQPAAAGTQWSLVRGRLVVSAVSRVIGRKNMWPGDVIAWGR